MKSVLSMNFGKKIVERIPASNNKTLQEESFELNGALIDAFNDALEVALEAYNVTAVDSNQDAAKFEAFRIFTETLVNHENCDMG